MPDFLLPDLGEGVHEGQIVRVHVKDGQEVKEDQPLLEVETDKAAVEIPSPYTGVVTKVHVQENQLVHVGDVMVSFGAAGETPSAPAEKKSAAASSTTTSVTATSVAAPRAPRQKGRVAASPAVRKLARRLGVEIGTVPGSGPRGRVTRADVEQFAAAPSAPAVARTVQPHAAPPPITPSVAPIVEPEGVDDVDQYGAVKRQPMTQARKTIARVMAQSWSEIPHVTDSHDADVTELNQLRRGYTPADGSQRKLTLLPFVVRAVARALVRHPEFNASFDAQAEEIIYRRYVNIAIGVHTERGLIAPVIRDADRMNVIQLADALNEIADKARTASFAVNDTRGGTYTISNPGALGTTTYSTPLITPPQVAVLGLGRARQQPWVVDGEVVPRLIMPLSHSFDHRIIDGGQEVAFMKHVVDDLQSPARLLLEG